MRIKHNISSLNSLRHAGNTMDRVKDSLQKLSSGLSINSGADSPANLIASERMRGRIIGLQQAHENASLSVSIVQTAEGALNEISSILLRLKQLTVHAANEATNDKQMLAADQQEIEHLLSSLDRMVKTLPSTLAMGSFERKLKRFARMLLRIHRDFPQKTCHATSEPLLSIVFNLRLMKPDYNYTPSWIQTDC